MIDNKTLHILNDFYKKYALLKPKEFLERVKYSDPSIQYVAPPLKVLKEWYNDKRKKDPGLQNIKKRNVKIRKYKIEEMPGTFQMDLVFFYSDIPWLMIINVPSRYVWLWLLESKTEEEILPLIKDWYFQFQKDRSLTWRNIRPRKFGVTNKLSKQEKDKQFHMVPCNENERYVRTITSDHESAFLGHKIQAFFKSKGIKHFVKDTTEHNSMMILDSAVRKIKDIFQYNISNDSVLNKVNLNLKNEVQVINYFEKLYVLVEKSLDQYNQLPMPALHGLMPIEAEHDWQLQDDLYEFDKEYNKQSIQANKSMSRFNLGDYVKIKERRTSKIQKARYYSDKVYRIIEVHRFSYRLGDIVNGQVVLVQDISDKHFKPQELLKVDSKTPATRRGKIMDTLRSEKHQIRDQLFKDKDYRLKKINRQVKPVTASAVSTRSKRVIKSNKNNDYIYNF